MSGYFGGGGGIDEERWGLNRQNGLKFGDFGTILTYGWRARRVGRRFLTKLDCYSLSRQADVPARELVIVYPASAVPPSEREHSYLCCYLGDVQADRAEIRHRPSHRLPASRVPCPEQHR